MENNDNFDSEELPVNNGGAASNRGRIIPVNIEEQMKTSYIDYSMSVIVGRALPDVRDGSINDKTKTSGRFVRSPGNNVCR